jgi:hypothetical protein
MKAQIASAMTTRTGAKDMKYILLMSGTRAGAEAYHALPKQDINAHMAVLHRINQDLAESGELVATQGLTEPKEAKVVRGEKNGVPVTDGIFPESKEMGIPLTQVGPISSMQGWRQKSIRGM